MPGLSIYAGGLQLLALIGVNRYVSLHSADPGLMGANEIRYIPNGGTTVNDFRRPLVVGGTTADQGWTAPTDANPTVTFNRQAHTFQDPEDGQNPPQPTHWGLWDAATGGNFIGSAEISPAAGDPDDDSIISIPIGGMTISQPVG